MQTANPTDTVRYFNTREGAVAGARAFHDKGYAATVTSYLGAYAAVNLDVPVRDVTAALEILGYPTADAAAEALRLVKRGY